jgi:hypothetical protein
LVTAGGSSCGGRKVDSRPQKLWAVVGRRSGGGKQWPVTAAVYDCGGGGGRAADVFRWVAGAVMVGSRRACGCGVGD